MSDHLADEPPYKGRKLRVADTQNDNTGKYIVKQF